MSLFFPNFDVKLIFFFPNLARGLFQKLLEKALQSRLKELSEISGFSLFIFNYYYSNNLFVKHILDKQKS